MRRSVFLSLLLPLSVGCSNQVSDPGFIAQAEADIDGGVDNNDANVVMLPPPSDNQAYSTFDDKNGWATDYMVLIDPTLQPDDQSTLLFALSDWASAVSVHFSTWVSVCDKAVAGQICIHSGADFPPGTGPGEAPGITGYTYNTALHELGHAMGLVHHTGPYIMNPCVNCSGVPSQLTADDADQWLMLRGYPLLPANASLPSP
jgi:hypothetical protein